MELSTPEFLVFVSGTYGPDARTEYEIVLPTTVTQSEEEPEASSWWTLVLDGVQFALDVGGFAPGLGIIFDLANAGITLGRGNYQEALINLLASIPGLGDAAKLAKMAAGGGAGVAAAAALSKLNKVTTAVVPTVTDAKLTNLVSDLYKGAKGQNPIGTGSTADAVRNELRTGLPAHGVFYSQEAVEYINALTNWMKKNPNASSRDRLVAQSILDDLKAALAGN
ncbi:MAG: hypothetical protein KF752_00730 [Pirellulaceae bacterium]|nr:hypothetical protein [Pirellulaceae bacterium]